MFKRFVRKVLSYFPKFLYNFYIKYEEALVYIFFGGLTTIVAFVSQFGADFFGASTALATLISWICSVTFAFFTNKWFVFEVKSQTAKEFFLELFGFFSARAFTFLFELVFKIFTVDFLHWNYLLMKILAQIVILVSNYLFSKFVVFRKKSKSRED